MRRRIFAFSVIFSLLSISVFAGSNKLEPVGAFSDAAASDALKKAIEEKGYRVTLSDGTTLCDIWLRKAVPTQQKKDISGAMYTEITDSALIGVVSFPKTSSDFRGQEIKAGAYSLRYSLHPTDGNHMGIAPYRDFLLLVPVSLDQNPDATYKFEELTKMSAKTNGSNHPAPFSMLANESKSDAPTLSENEHSYVIFNAKLKSASGTAIPIAFVIKGQAEQ